MMQGVHSAESFELRRNLTSQPAVRVEPYNCARHFRNVYSSWLSRTLFSLTRWKVLNRAIQLMEILFNEVRKLLNMLLQWPWLDNMAHLVPPSF